MAKSAQDSAAKWLAAMQAPATSQAYAAGVAAVTVSPTAQAATPQAEQLYLQGVQDAVSSGRRAAALNSVTLQAWQAAASGKGAQRLSSGAQAAQGKVQAFFTKFAPVFQNIHQTVNAMPKGGMANSLARVQTAITLLKQAAGKPVY
jgi:hypothetical protein